jgi:hypothetical protein
MLIPTLGGTPRSRDRLALGLSHCFQRQLRRLRFLVLQCNDGLEIALR